MKNDLISREALKKQIKNDYCKNHCILPNAEYYCPSNCSLRYFIKIIDNAPTVTPDKIQAIMSDYLVYRCEPQRPQGEFSRKDIESWLYQIAMNNIGTDFEKSVVEIIHRLDGFERFVSEQKSGADNDV